MKYQAVEFLVCPICHSDLLLTVTHKEGDEVISGSLKCDFYSHTFDIHMGIPYLIANDSWNSRTAQNFGYQWSMQSNNKFEESTIYGMGVLDEIDAFLDVFAEFIYGRPQVRVLDAGCGNGRMIVNLAAKFPEMNIIGVDVSESVHDAFEMSRHLTNLHLIRADIFALPFREGTFNAIWSEGVLHHTVDPASAFARLSKMISLGGRLFVWVYPHGFHPYRLLRNILIGSHRLPMPILYSLSRFLSIPIIGIAMVMSRAGWSHKRHSRSEIAFAIFDSLAPEYRHYHTESEVSNWFVTHGYHNLSSHFTPVGIAGDKQLIANGQH